MKCNIIEINDQENLDDSRKFEDKKSEEKIKYQSFSLYPKLGNPIKILDNLEISQFQHNRSFRNEQSKIENFLVKNKKNFNKNFSENSVIKYIYEKNALNHSLDNSLRLKIASEFKLNEIKQTENHQIQVPTNMNLIEKDNNDYLKGSKKNFSNQKNLSQLYNFYQSKLNEIEFDKKTNSNENILKKLNFGLIIEGSSISLCLDDEVSEIFWNISSKSRSIIACRCNPSQKAEIVTFVKNISKKITLAIGDGGNDVNMIKAANIGVGIFGKEGYQAAYSSDYAISQFKFLKRLIFYHGRYSLMRNSYFLYFFFLKNIMFTFAQVWLGIYTGFSGSSQWDNWYILGYNSFLTVTPAGVRMLYEEDIQITSKNSEGKEVLHELAPDIYKEFRDSLPFTVSKFFTVFFIGILMSIIVFFVPLVIYFFSQTPNSTGNIPCFWDFSLCSYMAIVVIQVYIVFHDTYSWVFYGNILHLVQLVLFFVFVISQNLLNQGNISGILTDIIGIPIFWLSLIITSAFIIIPFKCYRNIEIFFQNNIINNFRFRKIDIYLLVKKYQRKLDKILKMSRFLRKFRKFYEGNYSKIENNHDQKMLDIVQSFKKEKKKTLVLNIEDFDTGHKTESGLIINEIKK